MSPFSAPLFCAARRGGHRGVPRGFCDLPADIIEIFFAYFQPFPLPSATQGKIPTIATVWRFAGRGAEHGQV